MQGEHELPQWRSSRQWARIDFAVLPQCHKGLRTLRRKSERPGTAWSDVCGPSGLSLAQAQTGRGTPSRQLRLYTRSANEVHVKNQGNVAHRMTRRNTTCLQDCAVYRFAAKDEFGLEERCLCELVTARCTSNTPSSVYPFCSVLFCIFYIRWRPIKASDELVGEL
jgi:hypothetical protein